MACKDCLALGISTKRPAPYPGPRCASHHRQKRRQTKARAHEIRIEKTFGISGYQYAAIKAAQGGKCYVCQRATGAARALAVDHEHGLCVDHPSDMGCPNCIRALLCSPCNQLVGRYGVEALSRAIEVLLVKPAQKVLWDTGYPPGYPELGG